MNQELSVSGLLANYDSKVHKSLESIINTGVLARTGRMIIYPVDQGFEHGPLRSFESNPDGYDPVNHYCLAFEAGFNAFAAPLGMLEIIKAQQGRAYKHNYRVPTILKLNSANSLLPVNLEKNQAITGSVADAVRLGCAGIGFTIYPGSEKSLMMMRQISEIRHAALEAGLITVIWSYPRGSDLPKRAETSLDVTAYAAHMAALLGAHIIKVKLPSNHVHDPRAAATLEQSGFDVKNSTLKDRVKYIVDSCFNGRRIVVFSGGDKKDTKHLYEEVRAIRDAGGHGSIIGRNCFQRKKEQALEMINYITEIYRFWS